MGSREVSLYFLGGFMGFVALFVLCMVFNVVCPRTKIRACWLRCRGYELDETDMAYYAKLQHRRREDMS